MKPELKMRKVGEVKVVACCYLQSRAGRQLSGRAFAQHMRDPKSPGSQNKTQTWEKVEGLLG